MLTTSILTILNFLHFVHKTLNMRILFLGRPGGFIRYLTLRSDLSLNNPQNSEMNFCEKYEIDMLKIIIIIIGRHSE